MYPSHLAFSDIQNKPQQLTIRSSVNGRHAHAVTVGPRRQRRTRPTSLATRSSRGR
jgi:hypothetical protein